MGDQSTGGLLSPWLRERRMNAARPHLQGKVLDFGCGAGGLSVDIEAQQYLGVDRDAESLEIAHSRYPDYRFLTEIPPSETFDTITLLAVIEHIPDPVALLKSLASQLSPGGRIVLTTPHPSYEWAHTFGARLGIFSREASEEHEQLIDQTAMQAIAQQAGLKVVEFRRFLFGVNQIFVLQAASESIPYTPLSSPRQISKILLRVVSVFLPIIAIGFVGQRIWTNQVWQLETINVGQVVLVVLVGGALYTLGNLLVTLAWHRLLIWFGEEHADLKTSYMIYGRTQIVKYIPGNVLFFPSRHLLGQRAGYANGPQLGAVAYEILGLFVGSGLIALIGLIFGLDLGPLSWPVVAAILAGTMIAPPILQKLVPLLPMFKDLPIPEFTWKELILGLLPVWGIYVIFFTLTSGILWFAGAVIAPDWAKIPVFVVLLVYAVSWLAGFITPGAPAGAGVREAVMVLILGSYISESASLVIALVARLITVLGDVFFYLTALAMRFEERDRP